MKKDFLKELNNEQKEAVIQTEGPCLILAGAGSGKTKVLTYRTAYLIDKGVAPENIFLTTFTNKAANEMKERIKKLITIKSLPLISTFHSLCAKILRIEGEHIGISSKFVIYDEQDQLEVVKDALKKLDISTHDFKPSSVLAIISSAKNELITSTDYSRFTASHFQKVVSQVYLIYQQVLEENDALDFDDLILKTIELFTKNGEVLIKYQNRFRYVLVDEYQDTNHAQYQLTKMLAWKNKNICVVGDFSQSIYSWRGADFENLGKFEKDFKSAKIFSLSQNYRSTQKILDAATSVISNNTSHPVLELWTKNPTGHEITVYEARNEQDEAKYIVKEISNFISPIGGSNFQYRDFAVLYRTNAQSRAIEEVFLHSGMPYALIGGTRFYERREIKDVLAYLRVIANSKDMVSYKRIEKLGKERLKKFLQLRDSFTQDTTIDILDEVLKAADYLSLYDEDNEENRQRLENIKELRSVAIEFPQLTQFLENVSLVEQEYLPDHPLKNGDNKNAASLMTLHAAKGLEFPIVFMVGMEEGLFPHSRSLMDRFELEEERRLCYVGMTRAKLKLYLTYARRRLFFGQKTANSVSRFILELPEEVVSEISVPKFL